MSQLCELEGQMTSILMETKSTEKLIYQQEDDIDSKNHRCETLEAQNTTLCMENIRLKFEIEKAKEEFEVLLSRISMYREKIEAHVKKFLEADSKLPVMSELSEKQHMIKMLKEKKEELMNDLQNPEGNIIKEVQREIAHLEEEISAVKQSINAKNIMLEEEKRMHTKLRKDIAVQNKRCDAILKRLHCQLKKVQSSKRQCYWNIQHMEEDATELRKRLGIKE
ncbi:coiled-coil domain-containing protein 122 isoform X2 [Microcaecilia unicolor]|uniref:Coiled-coil domain-containing protein 122 isoform X2 n=1 Tax=Microcaecilia unicolor TaxID=1415580 RepID=A0A6P7XII2_9AMPH|nr:coiled-coil domain-containing protein 122 isoform X2 [Microcaecilia unicolor]